MQQDDDLSDDERKPISKRPSIKQVKIVKMSCQARYRKYAQNSFSTTKLVDAPIHNSIEALL